MSSKKEGSDKPRGRYGDGSIFTRKDGRIEAQFYLSDGTRKSVYGKTKSEARKKMKEVQSKAEKGELVATNRQFLADYMNQWLEGHKLEIRKSSYVQYRSRVNAHIIPALGSIQLQKLTQQQIQAFVNGMVEAGLEASTIHHIFMVLNLALKSAIEGKLLSNNPATNVKLPRIEDREMQILDAEAAQLLLQTAQGSALEPIVTLALATGMRCGEILGLKWSDIDFEQSRLQVQRTLVYVNGSGFYLWEPKTASGKRKILLASFALDALKEHRKWQREARVEAATWLHPEMVFTGDTGNYVQFKTLQTRFKKLLAVAGLPEMHFHGLRHSAATLLLSMRYPANIVQQMLGHSDVRTTLGIYGHVTPEQQEAAVNSLDALFSQSKREAK